MEKSLFVSLDTRSPDRRTGLLERKKSKKMIFDTRSPFS